MEKDFDGWHRLKKALDAKALPPLFHEREIWWCSVGINVGFEVFGKDDAFTRPVLILRKYNRFTFFGLPMTSQRKAIPAHYPINFKGRQGSVLLDQGKTFDSRRLVKRMGKLYQHEVDFIRQAYKEHL